MIIHAFEEAGLGTAPFKLVDVYFAARFLHCEFCGTGIKEICVIEDQFDTAFIVGNVCVNKTGDRGLIDTVKKELGRIRKERKDKEDSLKIQIAQLHLEEDKVKNKLASAPHPVAYLAEQGKTNFDYISWLLQNAGTSGKLRAAKEIEKIYKETL